MAIYDGDQQQTTQIMINGVHTNASNAIISAVAPASSAYKFTASYSHVYNKQMLTYRKGQTYILDAALKAVLLAAGAPMVATN